MNNYQKYVNCKTRKQKTRKIIDFVLGVILFPIQILVLIIWEVPVRLLKKVITKCRKKRTITDSNIEVVYDCLMERTSYSGQDNYLYLSPERYPDYLDFALRTIIIGAKPSEYKGDIKYEKREDGGWISMEETLNILIDKLKLDPSLSVEQVIGVEGIEHPEGQGTLLTQDDFKNGAKKELVSSILSETIIYRVSVVK